MLNLILGIAIGLLVGWLFIPAPKAVTDFYAKWSGK